MWLSLRPWGFIADWRVTVPPGGATTEGAGCATTGAGGGGIMLSTLSTGRGATAIIHLQT